MSDGGKGSAPRPIPNPDQFRSNWDAIFKPKCPKCKQPLGDTPHTCPAPDAPATPQ